jgi:hypothetical protein
MKDQPVLNTEGCRVWGYFTLSKQKGLHTYTRKHADMCQGNFTLQQAQASSKVTWYASFRFVSFRFVSFRFVSFRFVSFRFVSFRFVSLIAKRIIGIISTQ